MLALYREALRLRRGSARQADDRLEWLEAPAGVLAFGRGATFSCVVNFSAEPVPLPPHVEVLLTSAPLDSGRLPADTAAWLRTASRR